MDPKQAQLLKEIQRLEFVAVELHLFLDTHPQDQEPLNDFKAVVSRLSQLKSQYESLYGPLTLQTFTHDSRHWRWIEGPWPWEMVNY